MKQIKNRVLSLLLICTMIFSCFSSFGNGQKVEAADTPALDFAYRYGTDSLIQVNTNLPATTPTADFLATDNGCNLGQSGDQNVGWIGMANADGTIVLTFNFNNTFASNQTYVLSAESVFGFTDGNTYTLNATYTFTWDGTSWTMTKVYPDKSLSFKGVHYGIANQFLIETNLTDAANCSNFLATENGNDIRQSGSQQAGYFSMHNFSKVDGKKIITPIFNADFVSGESYTLEEGSKFVLGDGTYILDKNYTFTYNGSGWTMEAYKILSFNGVHYGTATQILIETNLTDAANCSDFLATDDGNDIKQDGNQQVGYFSMHNFSAIDGKKLITPIFNAGFSAGQFYTLKQGSKFVLGNGSYILDKNYTFTYNGGESWSMTASMPTEEKVLSFTALHSYFTATQVLVYSNLPDSALRQDFSMNEDGNEIVASGSWNAAYFSMEKTNEQVLFKPSSTTSASAGDRYRLEAGSKFALGDGIYTLDATYIFTCDGSSWSMTVLDPTKEYVEIDGSYKEVVHKTTLNTIAYETSTLVQFGNIHDFGFLSDNSTIQFSGELLLDGVKQDNVQVLGYTNSQTICFNNLAHEGKLLTIKEGSVLYVENKAVVITETFEKMWINGKWREPADGTFNFTKIYGGATSYLQVFSDLPLGSAGTSVNKDADGYDWLMGTTTFNSISYFNIEQQLLFSFNLDSNTITEGTTLEFKKGTVVSIQEGRYELDRDYTFTYSGGSWTMKKGKLDSPDSTVIADVNGDGTTNSCDLVRLIRVLEGEYNANNQADMNMDGIVDVQDAKYLRYLIINPTEDLIDAQLATFNFAGGEDFITFADLPVDSRDPAKVAEYKELGFNTSLLTEDFTGAPLNVYRMEVTEGTSISAANPLTLVEATYTNGKCLQFTTNLSQDVEDFLVDANSPYVKLTNNRIAWVSVVARDDDSSKIAMTFNFDNYFKDGEQVILKEGLQLKLSDGVTYTLDRTYTITVKNDYLASLQNLDEAGLDVWIRNYTNQGNYFTTDLTNVLLMYQDSIDGFYIADEAFMSESLMTASGQTNTTYFAEMGNIVEWKNINFPNAYLHANQVPISSYDHYDGEKSVANYKTFLNSYIENCINKVNNKAGKSLCYDNYPFVKKQGTTGWWIWEEQTSGIMEDYLINMLAVAQSAKTYNATATNKADFGLCIQTFEATTTEGEGGRDISCAEEVSFQLYTGMAMGANMFEYFAYNSNDGLNMYGIMNQDGTKRIYNEVKTANDNALCFSDVINTFDWQGIVTVDGTTSEYHKYNENAFNAVADMELTSGNIGVLSSMHAIHDAVIGHFTKGARDGYMVVNYNDPVAVTENNTGALTFEGCTKARVYTSSNGTLTSTLVTLENGVYNFALAPGSAFFIIPA